MMKRSAELLAVGLSIALYLGVSGACVAWLLERTGGRFLYPLDDTYISMAMAKNLVRHGVMGLTRREFSASSSCPVWIWLIAAAYGVAGVWWWAPLALSLSAGAAALLVAWRALLTYARNAWAVAAALAAICLLAPLPALGLSGMEHTLHIALVLAFVPAACGYLGKDSLFERPHFYRLAALMAVMPLVRYESLFLVAIFCALAALRRRWFDACAAAIAAAVPVLIYGAVSVANGWEWLPNSLLLKGGVPHLASGRGLLLALGGRSFLTLFQTPHLLALGLLLAGLWAFHAWRGAAFLEPAQLMLFMVFADLLAHTQFAGVGWFFRYEAYLVAAGILAISCACAAPRFQRALTSVSRSDSALRLAAGAWITMAIVALLPLGTRGLQSVYGFPLASYNLFEQQDQMSGFLRRYYNGASIAANDVGIMNFENDLRCFDMAGLCNRDVFRLKRSRRYTTEAVQSLAAAAGVRIAIIYNTWFNGENGPRPPASWTPVGSWRILDNAFLGGDTVTFYAVQPEEIEPLRRNLIEYSSSLPRSVCPEIARTD